MSRFLTKIAPIVKNRFIARCDASEDDDEPDIMKQADALRLGEKAKFKTPPFHYDTFNHFFSGGRVNSYDGCRFIVQKQVNLNTQVSHFFWFGTAARPPMYQYRLILPLDICTINTAVDGDVNVEGELTVPLQIPENSLLGNIKLKSNFSVITLIFPPLITSHRFANSTQMAETEQGGYRCTLEVEREDETSTLQVVHSVTDSTTTVGYLQNVYPGLLLGGSVAYQHKGKEVATSLAGQYVHGEHSIQAQWDQQALQALYLRKVNEGRANIGAGLVVDPQGSATVCDFCLFVLFDELLIVFPFSGFH